MNFYKFNEFPAGEYHKSLKSIKQIIVRSIWDMCFVFCKFFIDTINFYFFISQNRALKNNHFNHKFELC